MKRGSQARSFSARRKRGFSRKDNSRNVWLLGSSSFLNDLGAEIIVPILPFYILMLGGGGVTIGLISGLRDGLSSIFKIFGGYISDKTGKRKPIIFLGYLISTIFKFLIVFANSWQYLLAFVSLERFGKFRDAPRDALISFDKKHKGRDFGIAQTLDVLGGIFGTIIVLVLFWKFQMGIGRIIFIAAVISSLSLIPIFFVKEHKVKKIKKSLLREIKDFKGKLKYFLFVSSVFSFANFGLYLFLILIVKEFTGSIAIALLFYVLFNAVYAVFLVPFGKLSDKMGSKKILIAGYFLFFSVTLGLFFFTNVQHLAIIFSIYGLVYAMIYSSQRKVISDFSDGMKGTAFGAFYTITGISSIIGGTIAGVLWNVSHQMMFAYLSGIAFLAMILLLFIKNND